MNIKNPEPTKSKLDIGEYNNFHIHSNINKFEKSNKHPRTNQKANTSKQLLIIPRTNIITHKLQKIILHRENKKY